eukprot:scaffold106636_cov36-Phaeocystis_antarctica.AAC.4
MLVSVRFAFSALGPNASNQLLKAEASLRCSMNNTPRSTSFITPRRSVAISAHEFHPADNFLLHILISPPLSSFLVRRAYSRLRTASCHCVYQPTQPRDSSRCSRCRSAFDMLSRLPCASDEMRTPSQL